MSYDRPFPFILNFLPGFAREKEKIFFSPLSLSTPRESFVKKEKRREEKKGFR